MMKERILTLGADPHNGSSRREEAHFSGERRGFPEKVKPANERSRWLLEGRGMVRQVLECGRPLPLFRNPFRSVTVSYSRGAFPVRNLHASLFRKIEPAHVGCYNVIGILARALRIFALLVLLPLASHAQFNPEVPEEANLGMAAVLLTNVFQGYPGFTAIGQVRYAAAGKSLSTQARLTRLNDQFSIQVDLSKVTGSLVPAAGTFFMETMGLDQVTQILRVRQWTGLRIFPKRKAYYPQNMDLNAALSPTNAFSRLRIDTTKIGQETMGKQVCGKFRVFSYGRDNRPKQVGYVWRANGLKGFPVKLELSGTGGAATTVVLSDVKIGRADTKFFEPPAGYVGYKSLEEVTVGRNFR